MAIQRTPVIPPQQMRSRRTYDRLIAAITASAADGSLYALTLPQLAKRAGVSTGAFYGRFAGKAAAIAAVLERQQAALRSRLSLLGAQARPTRDVRGWIEQVTRAMDGFERGVCPLVRVLIGEGGSLPEPVSADPGLHREAGLLLSEWGVVRPDRAEARAGFVLTLIGSMTRDAALHDRKPDLKGIETAALWYLSAP
ncbi:TetR/AcrR family transcriptional regulator [Hyphobacterium sp. SN044]|uniref:TetR/AcrR family transcriptional regulator n=1 Tax=Hyphobacterium sp. SN044 TaxID=2912575 RepID=UPI001F20C85B|nr:TetR family transcriptional regulator [Hyphobacterium sp. SN044]MCF8880479.1 TetR/AcrR family transcriptional regulator [Hyphobacterium sp. SN044]